MNDNQIHWDFLTQEEYAQSGYTGSDMNKNSEGYVESTLAMNAPGGLEVAGYL